MNCLERSSSKRLGILLSVPRRRRALFGWPRLSTDVPVRQRARDRCGLELQERFGKGASGETVAETIPGEPCVAGVVQRDGRNRVRLSTRDPLHPALS